MIRHDPLYQVTMAFMWVLRLISAGALASALMGLATVVRRLTEPTTPVVRDVTLV